MLTCNYQNNDYDGLQNRDKGFDLFQGGMIFLLFMSQGNKQLFFLLHDCEFLQKESNPSLYLNLKVSKNYG